MIVLLNVHADAKSTESREFRSRALIMGNHPCRTRCRHFERTCVSIDLSNLVSDTDTHELVAMTTRRV